VELSEPYTICPGLADDLEYADLSQQDGTPTSQDLTEEN
jgi:hypothetical protein